MTVDLVVVGAGVVGGSCALHAVRAGLRTVLIDDERSGRATDAGAGLIVPFTPTRGDGDWDALARLATDRWPGFAAELHSTSGDDCGYRRTGLLWTSAGDHDEALAAFVGRAPGFELVGGEDARNLHPGIGPEVTSAAWQPDGSVVDGRRLGRALVSVGEDEGLEVRPGRVRDFETADGKLRAVLTGRERIESARCVIAGGAWTPELADKLDAGIGMTASRGQLVHLQLDRPVDAWPAVESMSGGYLVPFSNGRVVVGATTEPGAVRAEVTLAGMTQVIGWAQQWRSALDTAVFGEWRAGLRPLSLDGHPWLGPIERPAGVWVASGLGSVGLTFGPLLGELAAALATGRDPGIDLGWCAPSRR